MNADSPVVESVESLVRELAVVLRQTATEIEFGVDDVQPLDEPLPTISARTQFERTVGIALEAFEHTGGDEVVREAWSIRNPLVAAVHFAFAQHRPLILTPDVIWMTIAQGFAHHINANPEALRPLFVQHEGKITLEVKTLSWADAEDWAAVVAQWSDRIRDEVGAELHDLLLNDFSTTTPTIRTASRIVMMYAFHRYFDYAAKGVCGIPAITLNGTVADWQAIADRVQTLARSGLLKEWTDRLAPICAEFIAAAEGRPSLAFWQQIYKPGHIYGGELVTGWLADLFPYLIEPATDRATICNPILNKPRADLETSDGIATNRFPSGLSETFFLFTTPLEKRTLKIVGGISGVSKIDETGALRPEIGWGVGEADRLPQIFASLFPDAPSIAPERREQIRRAIHSKLVMPRELVQLSDVVDGATIYQYTTHPWVVRSFSTYERVAIHLKNRHSVVFADLADGRSLGYVYVFFYYEDESGKSKYRIREQTCWVAVGRTTTLRGPKTGNEIPVWLPEETRIIASSVSEMFARLVDANGTYYFDEPDFVSPEVFPPDREGLAASERGRWLQR